MNFTREPIIESVITAREGCILLVRSARAEGAEEYFVDAVEVVSFGPAFFFRCMERTPPFFLPVGHYEVVEVKESRMELKASSFDKSIKIGQKKDMPEKAQEPMESKKQKKSKRRRGQHGQSMQQQPMHQAPQQQVAQESSKEQPPQPPVSRKLFPPPSKLIKDQISKYKPQEGQEPQAETSAEEKPKKKEESFPEEGMIDIENPPEF